MLEAMARMAPSQPNEAMARIAPRSPVVPMVNMKISLDPSEVALWTRFEIVLEDTNIFEKRIGLKGGGTPPVSHHRIPRFCVQRRSDFRRIPL
jgi:hypothetical protein